MMTTSISEAALRLLTLSALAVIAVMVHACGCEQAGCVNEVRFDVRDTAGAPVGAVDVTYRLDGGPPVQLCCAGARRCDATAVPLWWCNETGFSIQGRPEAIELTVTATRTGATFAGTVAPQYGDSFYPNGRICGPECRVASESIEVF